MAPKEATNEEIMKNVDKIFERLDQLENNIDLRFGRLKEAIVGYINLGSEMAKGSVVNTLKSI